MREQIMCSVGLNINDSNCDLNNVQDISELPMENKELIVLRSNLQDCEKATICSEHREHFLHRYEIRQKKCCDLFNLHPNKAKKASLRLISVDQAKDYKSKLHIDAIPGKKLCSTCRKRATVLLQACDKQKDLCQTSDSSSEADDFSEEIISKLTEKEKEHEKLNESLIAAGLSPMKLHGVSAHRKVSAGKRKLKLAKTALKKKVACTLDLEEKIFSENNSSDEDKEIKKKASEFDKLMLMVKEKLPQVTHREKIQLLTLIPESWSRKKITESFNVTDHQVRLSRKLLNEKGLLSLPDLRIGKRLPQETIISVKEFYDDDEFSRLMPGQKDKVSIKRNVHVQKRLLLCNLHELYVQFRLKFPTNNKIGFSKFADLRPKHCILAGSSGTHCVCVCTIHQDVQLLIAAAEIEEKYQDLIQKLVCNSNNRNCMLRICSQCPEKNILEEYLKLKFPDSDPEDTIEYKQWVCTDRVDLTSHTSSLEDFINLLVQKIEKLIPHMYISKAQSVYLKKRKEELTSQDAIIQMDFSENFSFILQDEAQGYHWTHGCCTLHTVVLYVKDNNVNKSESICILSDDLDHDVPMVYQSQKIIIQFLKEKYSLVTNVEYFTDGCAAQYKNCKTFLNLCYHEDDFEGIRAKWSFFATSHGKSPCDGVGGTVKRLVSKASLQKPMHGQIKNVLDMYEYCKQNIKGITFFLITKSEMLKHRSIMSERMELAATIPGTRSMHYFECTGHLIISGKKISADESFSVCSSFGRNVEKILNIPTLNSYIACIYESHWYIGLISEIHKEEGDVTVKFMHPYGPSPSYYWPENDSCIVPFSHILCTVDINTTTGRTYKLSDESNTIISSKWAKYKIGRKKM